MALLKSGSTVGGNLIWHQGVLPLFPASDSIYYKNYKIYSTKDKPNNSDVGLGNVTNDAQVKKAGDTMTGNLSISTPGSNDGYVALRDAKVRANPDSDLILSAAKGRKVYLRANGDLESTGQVVLDSTGVLTVNTVTVNNAQSGSSNSLTRKDYVDNKVLDLDKLTVKKAGDTMTGTLNIDAEIIMKNNTAYRAKDSTGAIRYGYRLTNANINEFGDGALDTRLLCIGNPTLYRRSDTGVYTFYHTGYKPSKSDVGLGNVTNDPQLVWTDIKSGTGNKERYVKLISTVTAGNNQRQCTILFSGLNNYGGVETWLDQVSFSTRTIGDTGTANQSLADGRIKHLQYGSTNPDGSQSTPPVRFGMVKKDKVVELWVRIPAYCNGAKAAIMHIMGMEFNPVSGGETEPDGVFWVTPDVVYSTNRPPAADAVDAVSASQGGEFKKEVNFSGGVKINANFSGGSNNNGLYSGNGDGAGYDKCNMDLKSWYGIGISSTQGTAGRVVAINARTGSISTKGSFTADSNITSGSQFSGPKFLMSGSQPSDANSATRKDYVDTKISSLDTAKVNRSGDIISGDLTVQGTFYISSTQNSGIYFPKAGTNPRNMRIYGAGDSSRGNRIEIADDAGYLLYFERHPDIGTHLQLAGSIHADKNIVGWDINADGTLSSSHDVVAAGNVKSGGAGGAYLTSDGNIQGTKWGGWLSDWIGNNFVWKGDDMRNWFTKCINEGRADGRIQAWSTWQGAGAVGTYALLQVINGIGYNPNDVLPGSALAWSSGGDHHIGSPDGNWKLFGAIRGTGGRDGDQSSLWIRIS